MDEGMDGMEEVYAWLLSGGSVGQRYKKIMFAGMKFRPNFGWNDLINS